MRVGAVKGACAIKDILIGLRCQWIMIIGGRHRWSDHQASEPEARVMSDEATERGPRTAKVVNRHRQVTAIEPFGVCVRDQTAW